MPLPDLAISLLDFIDYGRYIFITLEGLSFIWQIPQISEMD